jgi:hypothetical protein
MVEMETDADTAVQDANVNKSANEEASNAVAITDEVAANDNKSSDIPKVQRKRKWFTNDSQKIVPTTQIVSISSETLKVIQLAR